MNSLQRSKKIEAYADSQGFVSVAIKFLTVANLMELVDGVVPSRTRSSAVRVVRAYAAKLEEDARKIAADGGVILPPDMEAQLARAKNPPVEVEQEAQPVEVVIEVPAFPSAPDVPSELERCIHCNEQYCDRYDTLGNPVHADCLKKS